MGGMKTWLVLGGLGMILAGGCRSPLLNAAKQNDLNAVQELIDKGADVNKIDYCEETPLMVASGMGNVDSVKLLLDRGADVNRTTRLGNALSYAALNGQTDVARLLIARNADINKALAQLRTGAGFGSGAYSIRCKEAIEFINALKKGLPPSEQGQDVPGAVQTLPPTIPPPKEYGAPF